jgi:hypothetical protein
LFIVFSGADEDGETQPEENGQIGEEEEINEGTFFFSLYVPEYVLKRRKFSKCIRL